jgi:hypothetical protein
MPSSPARAVAIVLLPTLAAAAAAFAAYRVWRLEQQTAAVQAASEQSLQQVLGELNRIRIEESSSLKGPAGLLEKLRVYAPMLASSRTTEPDFKNAQKEMEAILRALASRGAEAWAPLQARLAEVKPDKDFDELKWLLKAAVQLDPPAGKQLLKEALLGHRWPSPRLRYHVASLLVETDKQLAQGLLRQVLLTESARGIHPDRAAAHDAPIPDRAALATNGFHNFVAHYLRSGDPETDDTLLMVMTRTEHDVVTIQECVKALGERRAKRASPEIQKLYQRPPGASENVVFLRHCATAIAAIDGKAAVPFLEEALRTAGSEPLAKHLQELLSSVR